MTCRHDIKTMRILSDDSIACEKCAPSATQTRIGCIDIGHEWLDCTMIGDDRNTWVCARCGYLLNGKYPSEETRNES